MPSRPALIWHCKCRYAEVYEEIPKDLLALLKMYCLIAGMMLRSACRVCRYDKIQREEIVKDEECARLLFRAFIARPCKKASSSTLMKMWKKQAGIWQTAGSDRSPLMTAWTSGRPVWLRQDVFTPGSEIARVMKKAVAYLLPFIELEKQRVIDAGEDSSGSRANAGKVWWPPLKVTCMILVKILSG